jgi:hypothetical protein
LSSNPIKFKNTAEEFQKVKDKLPKIVDKKLMN